jgi:hypothetical protein
MDIVDNNIKKFVQRKYYSCVVAEILMRHYNFKITSDTVFNDIRTLQLNSLQYGNIEIKAQFGYYDYYTKKTKEYILIKTIFNYHEIVYEYEGHNYLNDT